MKMNSGLISTVVQVAMELMDSDSDEEYDDLVATIAMKSARLDRNRIPRYCEDVVDRYFGFEFKRMFRLSRETFRDLVARYQTSSFFPDSAGGRPRISADKTCLVVLSYLGSQSSMYSLADRFDVSESSVHTCIERVLDFLNSISEEVISWPDSHEQERIKTGFLVRSEGKGPRNTIGCVDGCHIEIKKPEESSHSYFNRKKFPSVVLQGICNDRNKFIDVLVGFPGSAHDARVLREGPFFEVAQTKCADSYLLGDSAYPLLPWLLTPYRDNEQTFPVWKKRYNKCHSQQRSAIENAFGHLKQRFRRLYFVDAATVKQCCLIIMGACVLHNMCNEERDFFIELQETAEFEEVGNDDENDVTDRSLAAYSECLRKAIAQKHC
ncbi:putative nuclease HARBI1 [Rhipicephalus sanguineus]|uniref:putative nuclease HARBI1 n=1 Tax=Rhipicephalus sanguineus TaxID=34632 RepID=UPI0018932EE3|nr:putative nuclease HARBI1 [Rhipicephalus sanguineus]